MAPEPAQPITGPPGANVNHLVDCGVQLRPQHEQINASTGNGRLIIDILNALAQFEKELAIERTQDGLPVARFSGKRLGKPHKITVHRILADETTAI